MNNKKERKRKSAIYTTIAGIVVVVIVSGLLLSACGTEQSKTFTVGVLNTYLGSEIIIEGFKARMAELGYVEGENITYIYNGVLEADDPQILDAEIERLLAQETDLLFALSTSLALKTRQAVEGTDVAVLFAPVMDPVGKGLVESLSHPGGNATGVQLTNAFPKAVEWLLAAVPETAQVYVPYIAADATTAGLLAQWIGETATALGVEAVVEEWQSVEEIVAAIEALPEGAVVFSVPAPSVSLGDFVGVATERGIAVGATGKNEAEAGALVAYGVDPFAMGEQAARMADQLFQGIAPADLPVETAEYYLSINLRTAEAIGLDIPDTILRQADTVIR